MYCKVRFTNRKEHTAGLIFDAEKLRAMSIQDISRYWPYSEAFKMRRMQVSPDFATEQEAFSFEFPAKEKHYPRTVKIYKGVVITPVSSGASGIRWCAFMGIGLCLRADTLQGIRQLISDNLKKEQEKQ